MHSMNVANSLNDPGLKDHELSLQPQLLNSSADSRSKHDRYLALEQQTPDHHGNTTFFEDQGGFQLRRRSEASLPTMTQAEAQTKLQ